MGFRRISPSPQMAKKERENIEGTNGQVGHVGSVVPGGATPEPPNGSTSGRALAAQDGRRRGSVEVPAPRAILLTLTPALSQREREKLVAAQPRQASSHWL